MTEPEGMPRTPAEALRALTAEVRAHAWPIDVRLAAHWIFLCRHGFALMEFGDAPTRDRHLGKWIVDVGDAPILDAVKRILPAVANGTIRLLKFSNVFNIPRARPIILAYCLEGDRMVADALQALGWRPRFKLNRETFEEQARATRRVR